MACVNVTSQGAGKNHILTFKLMSSESSLRVQEQQQPAGRRPSSSDYARVYGQAVSR
jgi:hypothetical protein